MIACHTMRNRKHFWRNMRKAIHYATPWTRQITLENWSTIDSRHTFGRRQRMSESKKVGQRVRQRRMEGVAPPSSLPLVICFLYWSLCPGCRSRYLFARCRQLYTFCGDIDCVHWRRLRRAEPYITFYMLFQFMTPFDYTVNYWFMNVFTFKNMI